MQDKDSNIHARLDSLELKLKANREKFTELHEHQCATTLKVDKLVSNVH